MKKPYKEQRKCRGCGKPWNGVEVYCSGTCFMKNKEDRAKELRKQNQE